MGTDTKADSSNYVLVFRLMSQPLHLPKHLASAPPSAGPYDRPMKELATARVLFYVMAASFVLSAAILGYVRSTGKPVPAYVLLAWGGLGVVGLALTPLLSPDRRWIALALLVVLGPWMLVSLVGDAQRKIYVMAAVDVAGLAAIGYGVWLSYRPA